MNNRLRHEYFGTLANAFFLIFCSLEAFGANGSNTDIVWRNTASDVNAAWLMPQIHWYDSTVNPGSTAYLTNNGTTCGTPCWKIVATGDFNRDGQADLLWRDQASGQNAIWLMNGTNVVTKTGITPGDASYFVVGTGDMDGDGYTDIIWRPQPPSKCAVWYMTGTNMNHTDVFPFSSAASWIPKAVGDFNNDSNPDIFLMNPTSNPPQLGIW